MKKIIIGIVLFSFFQINCGETKEATQGNYFVSKESFFDRTLKPYNYQLSLDTVDQALGKITFWRTQPIVDAIDKVSWTPNISFRIYNSNDKVKCATISLQTKAASLCKAPNIGGGMFAIGNFILLNTSPCVECAHKAKGDYCSYIVKHLLDYITDTNSSDLNYMFGQLPIKKGTFSSQH